MFRTRVTRQIEAAHHNGPPKSKCYTNHGHSWEIIVEVDFSDQVVDDSDWGWGVDFSVIKQVIDYFDHQDLNALLEPEPPSAENLARAIYSALQTKTGIKPYFVEVHEGSGNSVRYQK